ncbi:ORF6N domain-containing protein [Bacteroides salyersiae]|uniref:ORF6N domain-containing protein n=1 Tax=Bacteroides salyersiae TaxID=291644 RepID=UPI001C8CCAB9|nr:ORF6N domain-containing protein [Bacteroides salyersiae]UYU42462.1 ORF6N domain-containing protein [Bacteroides salyersiae]
MELQIIQSKIYEIRGQKVMLDRDLAELYQVETRVLNQAVKRNIKRFPSDFMFQVTEDEFEILKSQFVISSWGGVRKLPFAFTEQGLAMLSGILNSDVAIEVNISIMRAFVAVRRLMANPPVNDLAKLQLEIQELKAYIEEVFADYNDINDDTRMQIELINQTIAELQAKDKDETKHRNPIGFNTYKK